MCVCGGHPSKTGHGQASHGTLLRECTSQSSLRRIRGQPHGQCWVGLGKPGLGVLASPYGERLPWPEMGGVPAKDAAQGAPAHSCLLPPPVDPGPGVHCLDSSRREE